jgi:copper(I)-binding protein
MTTIATTADRAVRRNNVRRALLGTLASIVLLAVSPAAAGDDITVRQAWSRATPKGAQVAGGYFTIENHGATPDKLISAATTTAAKIEIHEMTTLDGIMMMRPVDGGLVIPPETSVTLAPGGNHLMFIGINVPFSEGEHIPVALMFERAGKIDVSFDVGSVGAKGPRMIIASTAALVPAVSSPPPSPEDFFLHLCGTRVMANVTVSPIRSGAVAVSIELENADEMPLAAQSLSVTLSNPATPVGPVAAKAERVASDKWRVRLPADAPGKWSLALGIEIAANDRVDIAAPILIEK